MRTETKEYKIYKFDELNEAAKESAIDKLYDINVDFEWWSDTYYDAENIGLILNEFDLGRSEVCNGVFKWGAEECADLIIKEHGVMCDTHKEATAYLKERDALVCKYSDKKQTDKVSEDNEYEFDCECDELNNEFLHIILEEYLSILRKEYEYLTGREAIIETIQCNEYEFTEDGKMY